MAGPYGQWPELEPEKERGGVQGEDYSEFLICQVVTSRSLSVCEQRNAALVRTTLGEREESIGVRFGKVLGQLRARMCGKGRAERQGPRLSQHLPAPGAAGNHVIYVYLQKMCY